LLAPASGTARGSGSGAGDPAGRSAVSMWPSVAQARDGLAARGRYTALGPIHTPLRRPAGRSAAHTWPLAGQASSCTSSPANTP